MFKIGDKVVHPVYGAGVLESICQKNVDGKMQDYYVMNISVQSMVIMLPRANCEGIGIRPVADRTQIETLLSEIPKIQAEMASQWSHRYQDNFERMKSGDPMKVAEVVKGLTERKAKRGLSNGEQNVLCSARKILISELALSMDESYENAEDRLDKVLNDSQSREK